jgi:hypothetical protein
MAEKLLPLKLILLQIVSVLLTAAALTGYRCPLHGCPACRMTGQS